MFLSLIIYLTYYTGFMSQKPEYQAGGARRNLVADNVRRGKILDRNGVELAYSAEKEGVQTRVYPYNGLYTHVIGYNSPIYSKSRLELRYDAYLSGSGGIGSLVGIRDIVLGEKKRGADLTLTIDHKLQSKAYELLGDKAGAIVALDPKTGEVLALASTPSYDPNAAVLSDEWTRLQESENSPFLPRATMGLYSPGSTFKAVTAVAAAEKGLDGLKFDDKGSVTINGRVISNSQGKAHGKIDVTEAFALSSNVVFSQLSVDIGEAAMRDIISRFRIGSAIPFDIELTDSRFNYDEMSEVDLAAVGIGQGKLQLTPMQMALIASAIANNGNMPKPYIVKSADMQLSDTGIEAGSAALGFLKNVNLYSRSPESYGTVISTDAAAKVRAMMVECVKNGTGKSAAIKGVTVAGKTGTAQNELTERQKNKEHSWFIAFAPADDPQIAVAIILEYNGESGGGACGPIAKSIISQWLDR
jgi:peptidoglycan glycosyltransferase